MVRNGVVVHAAIAPAAEAQGLFAGRLVDGPTGDVALGSVAGDGPDVFAVLNDARLADPVLVSVPAGITIDRPVVIIDWVDADGAAIYRQSFATIRAEADLVRFTADEEPVVVRMIHACGMVGLEASTRFTPGMANAARAASDSARCACRC